MTLVEFIHPLRKRAARELCLAVLFFDHVYNKSDSLTVEQIRERLQRARSPAAKANIADVLAKSGSFVDCPGKDGNRLLWALTPTGTTHVRELLGLPDERVEIEHDIASLETLRKSIADPDVADYLDEAIKCLSVDALRAAVVFLWVGAVQVLRRKVFAKGVSAINASLLSHDRGARTVSKEEDFSRIKESMLLLVAMDVGVLDKNQKDILEVALDLRNKCGHPGKYSPGPQKVKAFIEDVMAIVF